MSSIPGSGKSFGRENGNPLQYSCWENFMDRGAQQVTVQGVTKSRAWATEHMHTFCRTFSRYRVPPKGAVPFKSQAHLGQLRQRLAQAPKGQTGPDGSLILRKQQPSFLGVRLITKEAPHYVTNSLGERWLFLKDIQPIDFKKKKGPSASSLSPHPRGRWCRLMKWEP